MFFLNLPFFNAEHKAFIVLFSEMSFFFFVLSFTLFFYFCGLNQRHGNLINY